VESINIKIPSEWLIYFSSKDRLEEEIKKFLVIEWFRVGKISSGKGAELLNISKWEFYDLLTEKNLSTIDIDQNDLNEGSMALNEALEK
jgi:predicted HTH domain antitoxin